MNANQAARALRELARANRCEPWSELFLALDAAMRDGRPLPDDWQKPRFDDPVPTTLGDRTMPSPPGMRMARVVAADVRIGDELAVGTAWRRVVKRTEYGTVVELTCDEPPDAGPHAFGRQEPVVIRWKGPQSTIAMARELRRDRGGPADAWPAGRRPVAGSSPVRPLHVSLSQRER